MRRKTRRQKDHDDVGPIYPIATSVRCIRHYLKYITYRIDHRESLQKKDLYLREDFERNVIVVHLALNQDLPPAAHAVDELW
jgi:hypothetical protein